MPDNDRIKRLLTVVAVAQKLDSLPLGSSSLPVAETPGFI